MHAISKPLVISVIFTINPFLLETTAFSQTVNLPINATLGSSYYYNFGEDSDHAYALQQYVRSNVIGNPGPNLSLSGSGTTITLNGSPDTWIEYIGGIVQMPAGAEGATSDAPTQGGASGGVTTTLDNLTMNLDFNPGSGYSVNGLYGLFISPSGGTGGSSTSHHNSGAPGGTADPVNLTVSNSSFSINTDASAGSAAAIWVEQDAGIGGDGYHDMSAGSGGHVKAATLNLTDTSISTTGNGVAGIVVKQFAGAGGNAVDNDNSNGGDGGSASALSITLAQGSSGDGNSITTTGQHAHGIVASASGGAGSTGGDDGIGISIDVTPGNGGNGGNSGADPNQIAVSVKSTGVFTINTSGSNSYGIHATSNGGDGGSGGEARGSGINPSAAGNGGRGDPVTVNLGKGAAITTKGSNSSAILATTQGGKGGNSGVISANATGAQGMNGGMGGEAQLLTVTLADGVTLETHGDSSNGIAAIGSGGNAGDAGSVTAGVGIGRGGNGGQGGGMAGITVSSGAAITTSGETARGILAQAISGGGGSGADATGAIGTHSGSAGIGGGIGLMTITNSGAIITNGDYSQGILAQSISGSGGAAGNASGSPFSDTGGRGAAGASGGDIQLTNSGAITTQGESSQAIVAQSIGGDGGAGGTAGGMISVDGGAGGNGGAGGKVTLSLGGGETGALNTGGTLAHAIVAQSIGGGGGIGGNTYAAGLGSYSIGGTAGAGGAGGAVTVGGTNLTAKTTGTGAIGLLAQSVGGSGGAGGAAYATDSSGLLSFSVAVGGNGGDGGAPGATNVKLSGSSITTWGGNSNPDTQVDALGVVAQSIGGSGGVGGGASALATAISLPYPTEDGVSGTPTLSIAYAIGGSGGNGGSAAFDGAAATISLGDGSQIVTNSSGSTGAVVQSIGGGGGHGGDSSAMAAAIGYGSGWVSDNTLTNMAVNVSVAVGGSCTTDSSGVKTCAGGDGGAATFTVGNNATTKSNITTYGDHASGALVQSIGGGGGNAGIGSANANSIGTKSTKSISITTGSDGGTGGDGGAATATINADGVIQTSGVGSNGLLVQSIGGGGGVASGGSFDASGLLSWAKEASKVQVTPTISLTPTVNVGRTGGSGGNGGTVIVNHAGSITTTSASAAGIIAQSVGGGGGVGGTAGVAPAASASGSATQISGGNMQGVPLPTIYIAPTMSIGGGGGAGGAGGEVTANLSGAITTWGEHSPALLAQSIGGGGGMGGMAATGTSSNSLLSAAAQLSISSSISLGFNGAGGSGSNGGTVNVNLDDAPNLATYGSQSSAILAQSIGGGGGSAYDGSDKPAGSVSLGLTVSSSGGATGNGGAVNLKSTADTTSITTQGDVAHGVVLQSVGGGGGMAASGGTSVSDDWAVNYTFGGRVGAAGNGGGVTADFGQGTTTIGTQGVGSVGVIAQSVGGGGGLAAVLPGQKATVGQLGSDSKFASSSTSKGGEVTVSLLQDQSTIATQGVGSHGIVAQSVGGGGGMFMGYAADGPAPQLTSKYDGKSVLGAGSGGNVTVSATGSVGTTGPGAFGILAQSIGGGGGFIANNGSLFVGHTGTDTGSTAGTVTVNVDGAVSATGENSIGVFAQSSAPGSAGPITVNVNGTVEGGTGAQGVGIVVAGGNTSNQINIGKDGWVWGQSGSAIKAVGTWGTQKVDVDNQGQIYGNTWLQGGSIDGNFQNTYGHPPTTDSGTLTNSGTLMALAGKRSYVDGHLIQTATGRISPHLDYSNLQSGTYEVTGNAVLDGHIRPNLASALPNIFLPALTVNGTVTGALTIPDSPLFSYTLRETPGQYDVAITGAHFDGSRFGLTGHHSEVLSALEPVFASGDAELGPFFAGLDSSAGSNRALFRRTLDTVAHRNVMAVFARAAADASRVADAAMSCPIFSSTETGAQAFLTEGSCIHATAGGQAASLKGDGGRRKVDMDSAFWQVGGQTEISPGLFLGGLLAYQADWFDSHDGVSARGSSGQGAVTLKYQTGALLFTGALFGSVGEYEIERAIAVPGFSTIARSSPHSYIAGVRGRVAYTLGSEDFYLRPYLNIDLIHARSEGFSENGAGGLGLRVDEVRHNVAVVTPAVEFGGRHQLSDDMVLRSYVSGGVKVRSNDTWEGDASFSGGALDQGFSLDVPIDQVSGRVSAGFQLFTNENMDIRLQYDGEFGSQAQKHGASAGLSLRF
ncbi:MAG: hypothetical protein ACRECW_04805 [Phyllobacterium sp.]